MDNRYYFLSNSEYYLLYLFDLTRFVKFLPNCHTLNEDKVIPYSRIDELARVVYSRKNKSDKLYRKLISFVDRLQDILEKNLDIC